MANPIPAQDGAPQLTSTTAPGKIFATRKDLADHYKSDWHKYNLKRREAGLPLLLEADFQARLKAALSLRQEDVRNGTNHLKKGKKQKQRGKQRQNGKHGGAVLKSQVPAFDKMKEEQKAHANVDIEGNDTNMADAEEEEEEQHDAEESVVIDPKQCLFDRHFSATIEANADRMYRKYGFFIPDREYLIDLEGLIGYCQEKIKLGHMCLYCHKVFPTWQGCQKHMISKRHTKLKYEAGIDLEDLSVFYDFKEADNEFLKCIGVRPNMNVCSEADTDDAMDDDGDDDWEDVSDDDEMVDHNENDNNESDDGEDGMFDEYEEQLAQFGFDVTELGELVLPNGRVVGHRALKRYYKQRVPAQNESTAVVAARRAAGERLWNGQVVNIHGNQESTLALAKAGIDPNTAAGRAGKGILVKGSGGVYTSLSIYRYRAAMRKQRREDKQGKRLWEKSKQNINRMDKKANRIMNGVSVAHAAR